MEGRNTVCRACVGNTVRCSSRRKGVLPKCAGRLRSAAVPSRSSHDCAKRPDIYRTATQVRVCCGWGQPRSGVGQHARKEALIKGRTADSPRDLSLLTSAATSSQGLPGSLVKRFTPVFAPRSAQYERARKKPMSYQYL